MIDKDSKGIKKERNVQKPHKEKENNSKNSDDKYQQNGKSILLQIS